MSFDFSFDPLTELMEYLEVHVEQVGDFEMKYPEDADIPEVHIINGHMGLPASEGTDLVVYDYISDFLEGDYEEVYDRWEEVVDFVIDMFTAPSEVILYLDEEEYDGEEMLEYKTWGEIKDLKRDDTSCSFTLIAYSEDLDYDISAKGVYKFRLRLRDRD